MAQVEPTEGRQEGGSGAIKLTMAGHLPLSVVSMGGLKIRQLQSKKEKQVPERGNRGHGTMGPRRPVGRGLVSTESDGQRQPGPSVWRHVAMMWNTVMKQQFM